MQLEQEHDCPSATQDDCTPGKGIGVARAARQRKGSEMSSKLGNPATPFTYRLRDQTFELRAEDH